MDTDKREAILKATTFEELLDAEYGKVGTPQRDEYEALSREYRRAEIQ